MDHSCLAVGLENRGQLRRVEDYLADHNQMLLLVRKRVDFVVFWVIEAIFGSSSERKGRHHSTRTKIIISTFSPYQIIYYTWV